MLKGILSVCEEHKVPLRHCYEVWRKRKFSRSTKAAFQNFLATWVFGDTRGCGFPGCGRLPAVFWLKCSCGCGATDRVCRRHKEMIFWCQDLNSPPPTGTGTVYRQQIGRAKTGG